ncbi:MAG TPA: zf-HC2 domain-containing protein, partial [Acidimicrobiia bacterium]|nr:zf-HC2 domain-containing protein [Acidimicrobiia bacterium]
MNCNQCREIVSAGLDHEARDDETAAAAEHLRRCAACRAFADGIGKLHRRTRLAPAAPVPDLAAPILAAIGADATERRERLMPLRVVLAVVAVLEIGAAMPALLLGDDARLSAHAARHAGSFALALGVGFLWAA